MTGLTPEVYLIAAFSAAAAGPLGWIVRSYFDVYQDRNLRKRSVRNAIRADLLGILDAFRFLEQSRFIRLVSDGSPEAEELRGFSDLNFAPTDSRLLKDYEPDLFLLDTIELRTCITLYRKIVIGRMLFNKMVTALDQGKQPLAMSIASRLLPFGKSLEADIDKWTCRGFVPFL